MNIISNIVFLINTKYKKEFRRKCQTLKHGQTLPCWLSSGVRLPVYVQFGKPKKHTEHIIHSKPEATLVQIPPLRHPYAVGVGRSSEPRLKRFRFGAIPQRCACLVRGNALDAGWCICAELCLSSAACASGQAEAQWVQSIRHCKHCSARTKLNLED